MDIGTGIGQFLHHAKPSYSSVTGTEVSESAILIARQKYSLNVIQGAIEEIQFGDAKFDNITLFHVLEHVPSPRTVIEKCRSLLRSKGILVIAVPNELLALKSRTKVLLKKVGVQRFRNCGKFALRQITLDGSVAEIHVSHFTPQVLERLLAACGFSVVENSLDPYYALTGARKMVADAYYKLCDVIRMVTRYNIYDTIWLVARRI